MTGSRPDEIKYFYSRSNEHNQKGGMQCALCKVECWNICYSRDGISAFSKWNMKSIYINFNVCFHQNEEWISPIDYLTYDVLLLQLWFLRKL